MRPAVIFLTNKRKQSDTMSNQQLIGVLTIDGEEERHRAVKKESSIVQGDSNIIYTFKIVYN